ncbi:hypothetical protein TRP8649_01378 [Pelagimonas phthalicica]|uniref:DUF1064 domain-containing protein n=1 Tax=Pelagimonas phthalicica TaxID=1037362 RepID=A0A238JA56_9RHOB|nr:DUF1064 domain-containing protein [Pelagimonas phthalicica]TDS94200.1 uncharacterized protein DUF1064 [Pelagimonas phthalicica]SMX27275.1 hypothetical protein TRP8649_01378 [Pelagimonas phthalicica]
MVERISAAQLHEMQAKPKGQPRVRGAQRVTIGNESFDSQAEATRWQQLELLQRAGKISGLRRQVDFPLIGRDGPIMTDGGKRQRVYRADFVYVDHDLGITVIEDKKGHETEVFKLKRAILAAQGISVVCT